MTVLVDGGYNNKMLNSDFLERFRHYLDEKWGTTDAIISQSRAGVQEYAYQRLSGGNVLLGGGEYKYTSNWLVGTARYDFMLVMPWNHDCNPDIGFCE